MCRFLEHLVGTRAATVLTAVAYATLLVLILAKWSPAGIAFRYLQV